ncbi:SDR family NAD(P)-dependent oxidoreductase [Bacteriovorax stolpii]|uniref:Beta-ketoacyl-ACP reductase n=1 Tax=Bacteriovorax stolpii TaxID=960 RepID=A0A2K9NTQ0_BACTC|nr:3-oxoacyl-ACP reductase FabG [Bacteriovorax stolpii]AUN98124.1 beta-ketoacyl-ACP reductase [Bacteriovorax stolpii]QDK41896.1 SDR family NAD(P)-dependent oxidoreductase [Bacteriovorax stolpii]TDP52037.1 3-oxoacyl-[acyl-carrier-protein] reductase [Bacteriovorax stolpii]
MDFKDQTVIVTGGTRGIGRGITESFLKNGATVIATYAGNDEAARKMKEENSTFGEKLQVKKCDVRDEAAVIEFFKYIENTFPKIEVLINNSGIRRDQLTATMTMAEWNDVINTNLTGTFLMSKHAVLQFMKNRYGRIVNMSSIGGSLGLPGQANYAASKAGQIAISKSLSKEVAKRGITVNNVCPGFIDTELLADLPEDQRKEYMKDVPMKRFGRVEEVASAVLFLASREASYITGASLEISGGL